MVSIHCREMEPRDLPAVVAIEREAFTSPWSEDTFRSLFDRSSAQLWIAEDENGAVAAFAVLWCLLEQGELANIAVRKSLRGSGYGRVLLDRVLEAAKEQGVEQLYLEVRVSNSLAEGMYRRRGFRQIGIRRGYYDRPREDARVLMKRLSVPSER